jgi:8-oxo-dGTP pyrophosphatase MutT (NUDIX family)
MIEIQAAATVLLIREHPLEGLQVLLLKRNSTLKFAPSCWVFPGGRIDPEDGHQTHQDLEQTAKIAAAREASEEASLKVNPNHLFHYCHWTTPTGENRRFATWFFHCRIPYKDTEVSVDQSEIVDHLWIKPLEALKLQSTGGLVMLPPTFISLQRIKHSSTYEEVKLEYERTGVVTAEPRVSILNGTFYSLYKGDAGYETVDPSVDHTMHRLVIDQKNNQYRFEYKNCTDYAPVNGGVDFKL